VKVLGLWLAIATIVIAIAVPFAAGQPEAVAVAHRSVAPAAVQPATRQPAAAQPTTTTDQAERSDLDDGPGRAGAPVPDDEAAFIAELNAARTNAGLAPLQVDDRLTRAARAWTAWMSDRSRLRHADDIVSGAPDDWTKAGENVGRGGSVPAVWEAFMNSPTHAANVLDPAFTRIGVGVFRTPDGVLYTTHRFAGAASDDPPDDERTSDRSIRRAADSDPDAGATVGDLESAPPTVLVSLED